ncbi:GNAT family N-acetyltransferase [Natrarchaeobaculum sulfurireducens]|uniref:Acetyltransferase (GNAT) family n=1 Tax=Natrarchaeobaculum sulfurireducens TaxID=2044521 RepID=A0A346PUG8_9EURY|nr:GNAT family N-acetyltransferase [Natrarchaeobaculum sulfurireducens]AXR79393.1 Acetyltransferase (GNAT) family [Natrarchaeobaculum sulfurireducens]AXR83163.1 GNAT family acetyltransferase YjcF [Natrarchaeobaculum sulfurireducens]
MVDVRVVADEDERADAFAVRHAVFVAEQGVDETLEYDAYDADAVHFVAYDGDEAVGAARLREYEPKTGKVERVAVLNSRREEGIGRALMAAVEDEAVALDLETLVLHSQTHAADFYEALGYDRSSDVFEEAGIPHVEMHKALVNSRP